MGTGTELCDTSPGTDGSSGGEDGPDAPDESQLLRQQPGAHRSDALSRMRTGLVLSVAYSCNLGGTITLTGTGPNLVFKGVLPELFPDAPAVTYAQVRLWIVLNFPNRLLIWYSGFYLRPPPG